jgi:hypothetical protein
MCSERIGAWSLANEASTLPERSISTARVPPVPTSTPKSISYHPQDKRLKQIDFQSLSNTSFEDFSQSNASDVYANYLCQSGYSHTSVRPFHKLVEESFQDAGRDAG